MRKLLESAAPERTFLEPSDFFVFSMLLAVLRNTGAPFGAMLFSFLVSLPRELAVFLTADFFPGPLP